MNFHFNIEKKKNNWGILNMLIQAGNNLRKSQKVR